MSAHASDGGHKADATCMQACKLRLGCGAEAEAASLWMSPAMRLSVDPSFPACPRRRKSWHTLLQLLRRPRCPRVGGLRLRFGERKGWMDEDHPSHGMEKGRDDDEGSFFPSLG